MKKSKTEKYFDKVRTEIQLHRDHAWMWATQEEINRAMASIHKSLGWELFKSSVNSGINKQEVKNEQTDT